MCVCGVCVCKQDQHQVWCVCGVCVCVCVCLWVWVWVWVWVCEWAGCVGRWGERQGGKQAGRRLPSAPRQAGGPKRLPASHHTRMGAGHAAGASHVQADARRSHGQAVARRSHGRGRRPRNPSQPACTGRESFHTDPLPCHAVRFQARPLVCSTQAGANTAARLYARQRRWCRVGRRRERGRSRGWRLTNIATLWLKSTT